MKSGDPYRQHMFRVRRPSQDIGTLKSINCSDFDGRGSGIGIEIGIGIGIGIGMCNWNTDLRPAS